MHPLQISLALETFMKLPGHVLCARSGKDSKWAVLGFPASQGLPVGWDVGDLGSCPSHGGFLPSLCWSCQS